MIVIPMAGLSQRFLDAGYAVPKYMLDLNGKSVFAHAVESFEHYFADLRFVFIVRNVEGTPNFVRSQCERLGIRDFKVVLLDAPTAGQAETVEFGIVDASDHEPLTIFNIDTFRAGFRFPADEWFRRSDGYLEVFHGTGNNWSFVRASPDSEPLVMETAEKHAISDLCCSGLYHFAAAGLFRVALKKERINPSARELYVAPIYNHLLKEGYAIHYKLIDVDNVRFCGVPTEYEALVRLPRNR